MATSLFGSKSRAATVHLNSPFHARRKTALTCRRPQLNRLLGLPHPINDSASAPAINGEADAGGEV